MKDYAKVGKRQGLPAYRTAASFRYRKYLLTAKTKSNKPLPTGRQARKKTN